MEDARRVRHMLNQTSHKQVRPILHRFFGLWPVAAALADADALEVAEEIRTLGLQNIRARRLIRMSAEWRDGARPPARLHGVGRYASDSWKIFQEGKALTTPVLDKELKKYVEWAMEVHDG